MSEQIKDAVAAEQAQDNEAIREVLGKDDPFVKALESCSKERPVIDPTYQGQIGFAPCNCPGGVIHDDPACMLPDEKELTAMGWGAHNLDLKLPDYWFTSTGFAGTQVFYPWDTREYESKGDYIEAFRPTTPEAQAAVEYILDPKVVSPAFKKFFETFMPHLPATGGVMVFAGLIGETEAVYIRYEQDHVKPVTFVLPRQEFNYFLRGWIDTIDKDHMQTEMEDWCKFKNEYKDFQEAGYRYNVTVLALTPPLGIMSQHELPIKDIFENMVNGDFKLADGVEKQLVNRFTNYVAEITRYALDLKDKVKFKDHNLMLAFKATDDFKHLQVSLDKVYPKLPEGGTQECGVHPLAIGDWAGQADNVTMIIRKIIKLVNKTNDMFDKLHKELPDNAWLQGRLDKLIKEQLFASSHFLKEIYQANPSDIRELVEKTANEVLTALNNHGGNIGLDLTSWVVYQYFDDGRAPVPLVKDGLNFKQELYNTHTERFMEVLFQYLFRVQSPYVRPYVNKVIADASDGVAIGSIRPTKPE